VSTPRTGGALSARHYQHAPVPRALSTPIARRGQHRSGGSSPQVRTVGAGSWPDHVLAVAARERIAVGERGLVPRGVHFDYYISDPREPRRSGSYQFCVVGVDIVGPQPLRYYCWEPTGHFDRTFTHDEVDQRLAMERFGRSVAMGERPSGQRSSVATEHAHRKEGLHAGKVVRWPDLAEAGSLVHGSLLPNVDDRGRPVLPSASRFPPRSSVDLVQPMLLTWKHRFLPALREQEHTPLDGILAVGDSQKHPDLVKVSTLALKHKFATADPKPLLQVLVLDGSGRIAAHVQDELHDCEIMAIDDPPRFCRATLRRFRDEGHMLVHTDGAMDRARSVLHFDNGAFDVVILPFVLQRLCSSEEGRFLALLREALRVSRGHVLIAEDVVAPVADEGAFRAWKALIQAEWRAPVLQDSPLHGGVVVDHFITTALGGTDAQASQGSSADQRRFLIVDASGYSTCGPCTSGGAVALPLTARPQVATHNGACTSRCRPLSAKSPTSSNMS